MRTNVRTTQLSATGDAVGGGEVGPPGQITTTTAPASMSASSSRASGSSTSSATESDIVPACDASRRGCAIEMWRSATATSQSRDTRIGVEAVSWLICTLTGTSAPSSATAPPASLATRVFIQTKHDDASTPASSTVTSSLKTSPSRTCSDRGEGGAREAVREERGVR